MEREYITEDTAEELHELFVSIQFLVAGNLEGSEQYQIETNRFTELLKILSTPSV